MDNLWARRSNNSKLSLSTSSPNSANISIQDHSSKSYSLSRKNGDNSYHGTKNPFNTIPSSASLTSPTNGASSAFGLGTGAFASFGTSKAPKSNCSSLELGSIGTTSKSSSTEAGDLSEKQSKEVNVQKNSSSISSLSSSHPLRYNWVIWFRPPIAKSNGYVQYEKTLHPIAGFGNVEDFLTVYRHLKRPSTLPPVSDYHLFKKGVRPVWEDTENRKGGKWIVRLKKGISDRFWEDLVFAIIGDQFAEASDEVCGAVLSVRNGEDILSIWARNDGGRVLKIRETMKRILGFPPDTRVEWKSHDSSIQQRTAIDEHRKEKYNHHSSNAGRNSNRTAESFASPLSEKR
ncbi:Eukaryotic translation initiation factor 4E type 2 [Erysiphe neolycopersici]|uniref:Eukaryotic translation initiation factor 4E type 2 n=1 Tax=Erysiphe neolycopersici TaxID=212602 RepID=A0A420I2L7_9PEZI|nr:Eukaryotic translation initiation factor 4E type 2 [Erysiphe neolycopersici]